MARCSADKKELPGLVDRAGTGVESTGSSSPPLMLQTKIESACGQLQHDLAGSHGTILLQHSRLQK